MGYMNQELNLHKQEVQQLQAQLKETKDSLDKQQMTYQSQLEQSNQKSQADRRELTDKLDQLTSEITRRERACTTLENQKESLQQ
jgi:chromosome segregation ATPase